MAGLLTQDAAALRLAAPGPALARHVPGPASVHPTDPARLAPRAPRVGSQKSVHLAAQIDRARAVVDSLEYPSPSWHALRTHVPRRHWSGSRWVPGHFGRGQGLLREVCGGWGERCGGGGWDEIALKINYVAPRRNMPFGERPVKHLPDHADNQPDKSEKGRPTSCQQPPLLTFPMIF